MSVDTKDKVMLSKFETELMKRVAGQSNTIKRLEEELNDSAVITEDIRSNRALMIETNAAQAGELIEKSRRLEELIQNNAALHKTLGEQHTKSAEERARHKENTATPPDGLIEAKDAVIDAKNAEIARLKTQMSESVDVNCVNNRVLCSDQKRQLESVIDARNAEIERLKALSEAKTELTAELRQFGQHEDTIKTLNAEGALAEKIAELRKLSEEAWYALVKKHDTASFCILAEKVLEEEASTEPPKCDNLLILTLEERRKFVQPQQSSLSGWCSDDFPPTLCQRYEATIQELERKLSTSDKLVHRWSGEVDMLKTIKGNLERDMATLHDRG